MRRQNGFSLIELLIVVAILLVIAAIAIPNLIRARMTANQASAVASLRSIASAEIQYQTTYPQVGYSPDLVALGTGTATSPPTPCPPGGATQGAACLIDGALTAATTIPKSGYVIGETGVVGGGGINTIYVAEAGPVTFNRTGMLAYCIIPDNIVRANYTNGVSGLPGVNPANCLLAPFSPID